MSLDLSKVSSANEVSIFYSTDAISSTIKPIPLLLSSFASINAEGQTIEIPILTGINFGAVNVQGGVYYEGSIDFTLDPYSYAFFMKNIMPNTAIYSNAFIECRGAFFYTVGSSPIRNLTFYYYRGNELLQKFNLCSIDSIEINIPKGSNLVTGTINLKCVTITKGTTSTPPTDYGIVKATQSQNYAIKEQKLINPYVAKNVRTWVDTFSYETGKYGIEQISTTPLTGGLFDSGNGYADLPYPVIESSINISRNLSPLFLQDGLRSPAGFTSERVTCSGTIKIICNKFDTTWRQKYDAGKFLFIRTDFIVFPFLRVVNGSIVSLGQTGLDGLTSGKFGLLNGQINTSSSATYPASYGTSGSPSFPTCAFTTFASIISVSYEEQDGILVVSIDWNSNQGYNEKRWIERTVVSVRTSNLAYIDDSATPKTVTLCDIPA